MHELGLKTGVWCTLLDKKNNEALEQMIREDRKWAWHCILKLSSGVQKYTLFSDRTDLGLTRLNCMACAGKPKMAMGVVQPDIIKT